MTEHVARPEDAVPPAPVRALVREVRAGLAAAADPAAAPAMRAYMKSEMPFYGVRSEPLRQVCRAVYDEHPLPDPAAWRTAVGVLWDRAYYREERYAALALAQHHAYRDFRTPELLGLYRHLVVTGAWWDLVDTIASHLVGELLDRWPAEVTPTVRAWALDEDLWLRRTAILSQLRRKDRTDLALLAEAVEANLEGSLHGSEFFVRKAVGWALREYSRTDPEWVRRFVDQHASHLSGLSRREAVKHLPASP